jgi:phage terminase small subunit
MKPLDNQRHERFAQALARGLSATDAYAEAGYQPDRGNAARLTANDSIRQRVAEITAAAAAHAELTKADVLRGLMYEATLGTDTEGAAPSAARVAAWKLLGTELGMFEAKIKHDVSDSLADLIREANALPVGIAPPRPEIETRH